MVPWAEGGKAVGLRPSTMLCHPDHVHLNLPVTQLPDLF